MSGSKTQSWATEVHQITFEAFSLFACLCSCLWAGRRMNILFVFFEELLLMRVLGMHQGWLSAHPSTLRCCKLNRPGQCPSSCLSPSLLLVKGKTIMCLSSLLTVCRCVFLMALATHLFILFGAWSLSFSHHSQLYRARLLVTSCFFELILLLWIVCFVFKVI